MGFFVLPSSYSLPSALHLKVLFIFPVQERSLFKFKIVHFLPGGLIEICHISDISLFLSPGRLLIWKEAIILYEHCSSARPEFIWKEAEPPKGKRGHKSSGNFFISLGHPFPKSLENVFHPLKMFFSPWIACQNFPALFTELQGGSERTEVFTE